MWNVLHQPAYGWSIRWLPIIEDTHFWFELVYDINNIFISQTHSAYMHVYYINEKWVWLWRNTHYATHTIYNFSKTSDNFTIFSSWSWPEMGDWSFDFFPWTKPPNLDSDHLLELIFVALYNSYSSIPAPPYDLRFSVLIRIPLCSIPYIPTCKVKNHSRKSKPLHKMRTAMSRAHLWSSSLNKVKQSQGIASRMLYPGTVFPQGCIHTDTSKLIDEVRDTNPFFDKYKEKIEKVGGYVHCIWSTFSKFIRSLQYRSAAAFEKVNSIKKHKGHPQSVTNAQYPFTEPPVWSYMYMQDREYSKQCIYFVQSLDKIMHIDMILDKTPEEISQVCMYVHLCCVM